MSYYEIGVMQGRLLPKYKGRYQAHPKGYWQNEFPIAANLKLNLIEFILDYEDYRQNPLFSDTGLKEIVTLVELYNVPVKSVCADYFMEAPFHNRATDEISTSRKVLEKLIYSCSKIGVKDIVIPCVDQSSLAKNDSFVEQFVRNITPCLDLAVKYGISLALETDLPPLYFRQVLDLFGSDQVKVNYDTGNSAALGYNVFEEFAAYGSLISDIHIKDRLFNGGSVPLGEGITDFEAFFFALSIADFQGPFIMQAFRDEEGIDVFKRQLEFIKPKLDRWAKGRVTD